MQLSRYGPVSGSASFLGRSVGAEVLVEYASGPTAGSPAISRVRPWQRHGVLTGTSLTETGVLQLVSDIVDEAGVAPAHTVTGDVEVVRRSDGDRTWTFAINHGDSVAVVHVDGVDLLTPAPSPDGRLTVAAGGIAAVRNCGGTTSSTCAGNNRSRRSPILSGHPKSHRG